MSWQEKMKDWGGGEVSFLSEDGEAMVFVVVDEPVLLEGKFKGRMSERIGCPIVTQDGYSLFICGKRLARRLSRYESRFGDTAFQIVRRGEHNDIETSYDLAKCADPELTKRLFDWAAHELDREAIVESIESARKIVAG